jgi:uncharacterized membrane-anchored protein
MKTFAKKFVPANLALPGRAMTPEDRPAEVTEAKKKWKESEENRQLLFKLLAVAAERTAKACESLQGLGEQLAHMSGDGRGEESAFMTNIADSHRQCADCMATFKDALKEQVLAMREIEKLSNAPLVKAKQDFKKAEDLVQRSKKELEKRRKASGGVDDREDNTVLTRFHKGQIVS